MDECQEEEADADLFTTVLQWGCAVTVKQQTVHASDSVKCWSYYLKSDQAPFELQMLHRERKRSASPT